MEQGRGVPPDRPAGELEDAEEVTVPCDNWILASVYSWIQGGRPKDVIVEKVMTSFDTKEMRTAATVLRNGGWTTPQIQVPNEGTQDYSRRLVEIIVSSLYSIVNTAPLKVHFWVSAAELYKVPGVGAFPDDLDQPAVSARLRDVDNKLQMVLDRMAATEHLEETVAGLARTVTKLQEKLVENQEEEAAARGDWPERERSVAAPPVEPQVQTYADKVRNKERVERARSVSTKRDRTGSDTEGQRRAKLLKTGGRESRWDQQQARDQSGSALSQSLREARGVATVRPGEQGDDQRRQERPFTEVRRKKRNGTMQKGSSTVEAAGGAQAPFSVFLSGTCTDCTQEVVKEKLMLCAAAVGGEEQEGVALEILKVEHIPLKIPQGEQQRSRCWKVTVPQQFAEHIGRSVAYPSAWGWRKWNKGPLSQSVQEVQGARGMNGGV